MESRDHAHAKVLSQLTEYRKVEAPKPLIFRDPIVGFCLQKATLQQSSYKRLDTTRRLMAYEVKHPPIDTVF